MGVFFSMREPMCIIVSTSCDSPTRAKQTQKRRENHTPAYLGVRLSHRPSIEISNAESPRRYAYTACDKSARPTI